MTEAAISGLWMDMHHPEIKLLYNDNELTIYTRCNLEELREYQVDEQLRMRSPGPIIKIVLVPHALSSLPSIPIHTTLVPRYAFMDPVKV